MLLTPPVNARMADVDDAILMATRGWRALCKRSRGVTYCTSMATVAGVLRFGFVDMLQRNVLSIVHIWEMAWRAAQAAWWADHLP